MSNADAFPAAGLIRGDRNEGAGLSALAGQWDATIDVCGYVPRQVRSLLEALGDNGGHYIFISSISVYAPGAPTGFSEERLLMPSYGDELTMKEYGALKVGCELTASEVAGDRALFVRPGFVVGPHNPTHRFGYWVERSARGGSILGPARDQPIQVIDARDLGGSRGEARRAGRHRRRPRGGARSGAALRRDARRDSGGSRRRRPRGSLGGGTRLALSPKSAGGLVSHDGRTPAGGLIRPHLAPDRRNGPDTLAWMREARDAGSYNPPAGRSMTAEQESDILRQR